MTPGDAADMNTSSAPEVAVAAFRFSMSRLTASKSFQAMGPLQVGRAKPGAPPAARRAAHSGKSLPSPWIIDERDTPSKPVQRSLM